MVVAPSRRRISSANSSRSWSLIPHRPRPRHPKSRGCGIGKLAIAIVPVALVTMIAAAVIEVITRRCGENWITPIMKKWRSGRRTVPIVTVLAETVRY